MEDNVALKRGSVYQSSREVRRIIESTYRDETFLSFEILDTSSRIRRDDASPLSEPTGSPMHSLYVKPKSPPVGYAHSMPTKCTKFSDLSFRDLPETHLNLSQSNNSVESPLEICNHSGGTKLPCAKEASNSPCHSEREILKASPKIRLSPLKRMFDPILKPKHTRNMSLIEAEKTDITATDPAIINRNGSFRRSLLNDFSKFAHKTDYDRPLVLRDQDSSTTSSPAHLHAILKFEFKNGASSFEFSVKDPEGVLSAKTWSTDSAFSWAYTLHGGKKKGHSTKPGQSFPIVAQMQVSCFMCSEASENGSLGNSMVTEFVLYDIAQAQRRISNFPDTISLVTKGSTEEEKYQHQVRHSFTNCDSDPSTSYPWSPMELHPHLEIAAILIQIPLKKGNLKDNHPNLSSVSSFDNSRATGSKSLNPAVVKVVTPSGRHGLPSNEEGAPSSLLDRWRFGGGCDCGGWDMTCPIVVLDNPCGNLIDCSARGNQLPMLLFFQGRKEKVPALSITDDGRGQYSVDFHAQLSTLQAFSICIAMLHCSGASPAADQEKNNHCLHSNSLRLLLEEELKRLVEAVAEEKSKAKTKAEQIPPSFVLDHPPFSPMGRV